MNTILTFTILTLAATTLMACGETRGDRALSGAGLGAATGAVAGGVMGGNPWTGGIVGGALGAGAGALTNPDDFDLGKPFWR